MTSSDILRSENDRSTTKNTLPPEIVPSPDDYTKGKCFSLKKIYDPRIQKYSIHQLDQENFVLLTINPRSFLMALVFDRRGHNTIRKKGDKLVHHLKVCRQFVSVAYERKIFLVLDSHEMISLTGMLMSKYEARSATSIQLIAANQNRLFCLCNNEIHEYNHRFLLKKVITLAENEIASFEAKYARNVASGFKCTDTYLYLNVSTSLYIYDMNGTLMTIFNLGLNELSITAGLILTFDKNQFQLNSYDEEMNLVNRIELSPDKKRPHLQIIDSMFDQLLFVDKKKLDFFIYERNNAKRIIPKDEDEDECYGSNSSHRTDSSLCDTFEWIPAISSFLKR